MPNMTDVCLLISVLDAPDDEAPGYPHNGTVELAQQQLDALAIGRLSYFDGPGWQIFHGSYVTFPLDTVLPALASVPWELPTFVRLIICSESEDVPRTYALKDRAFVLLDGHLSGVS